MKRIPIVREHLESAQLLTGYPDAHARKKSEQRVDERRRDFRRDDQQSAKEEQQDGKTQEQGSIGKTEEETVPQHSQKPAQSIHRVR